MKTNTIISWVLLALSVVLGIVSCFVLPDTVVTQISIGESNATTMPKIFAVLVPFLISAGGAVYALFVSKGDDNDNKDKGNRKSLIVSGVGIAVYVLMLIVNLL